MDWMLTALLMADELELYFGLCVAYAYGEYEQMVKRMVALMVHGRSLR